MTALSAPRADLDASRISVTEFRAFEDAHPMEKWQLVNGKLYAMAGGTMRHARITRNLAFALHRRLQGGPCEVFIADANVVNEAADFSAYPDVVVRCGGPGLDRERGMSDPTACFEVLSPSTMHLDRGEKLFAYCQLPSVRHVGLVYADELRIETWRREGEMFEEGVFKRLDDALALAAFGVELPLAEIYEGVAFES